MKILLVTLTTLVISFQVYAQALLYNRNGEPVATYIKGSGFAGKSSLLGVGIGLHIAPSRHDFSISYRAMDRFALEIFSRPKENVWNELSDFSFLYQYNLLGNQLLALNLGSGFIIGKGVYRKTIIDSTFYGNSWSSYANYEFSYDRSMHLGIPIILEFTYKPSRFYAISIAGYRNIINYPEYGFMISHSFGIIRKYRTLN